MSELGLTQFLEPTELALHPTGRRRRLLRAQELACTQAWLSKRRQTTHSHHAHTCLPLPRLKARTPINLPSTCLPSSRLSLHVPPHLASSPPQQDKQQDKDKRHGQVTSPRPQRPRDKHNVPANTHHRATKYKVNKRAIAAREVTGGGRHDMSARARTREMHAMQTH